MRNAPMAAAVLVLLLLATLGFGDEGAATQPTTTRPVDKPSSVLAFENSELKVSHVVASVQPTAAQQEKVQAVLEEEGRRWMDWHSAHRQQSTDVDAAQQAAAVAEDEAKLRELKQQWDRTLQTIPRPAQAWEKVLALFDVDQRHALEKLNQNGREAANHELHRYFITRDAKPSPSAMEGCAVCHMRHHSISRKAAANGG